MMVIDNNYEIGDEVYLKTDIDQLKRIVTELRITPNGIKYLLSISTDETIHYDMEFSKEKDVLITSTN